MWLNKVKHPLQEHAYALYPLVTITTVIIISCRIAALSHAHSQRKISSPWSTVVSFGDSYSDTGNGARITGGKYPSEPWYWHHRFTNGPNWIDNLIMDLGGLDKVKMRNFAHGGATTDNALLQGNLLGHSIPGVHQQVRGFMLKSRHAEYPKTESTLYTLWTGAADSLAIGGVGAYKSEHKPNIKGIQDSIFRDILQLERESHNKIKHVLVLTPPPVEDTPMVKHESPAVRSAVRHAAQSITRELPHTLLKKFSGIGHTIMTNSNSMAPANSPHTLPNHRQRALSPIAHFLTVDLPQDYKHMMPHEHKGARPAVPGHSGSSLLHHSDPKPVDRLHHPLLKIHKRINAHDIINAHSNSTAAHTKGQQSSSGKKLHIMVYDAYHFIKHAETNPKCFSLNPAMMSKTCGEQKHCYDRVWMDDSNLSTPIHYWMAHDINARLEMWDIHNKNLKLNKVFKNSTRARELGLEMLGYTCPMRPAPVDF
ncbi:hypothetical protein COEREDRAFT_6748 [Coemansia reversa NRRL 1564]|uniref:SGNH hydrolase n=1 Tax=Coemansia reversa (strain ATCC 12441 / NRRL 1564) TaxID=763665 RepID=A0A2G5BG74_COERN|nr:hypothetical protein COEREDRAFT_6748 [Coemansia reversa NRRL 1564]|eukprot:PIA18001.1 hypothetical protein COEREDRAFT_6748 [Coemansia reversa NRRL 1564]